MRIMGIDPGAKGAIALLMHGKLVATWDMPTVTNAKGKRRIDGPTLATILRNVNAAAPVDVCMIELVGPMPRDGSAGSFWFGKAAGMAEGVCAGLGIPVDFVAPQVWKRKLDVPTDKNGARARATRLFNRGDLWPLVKHDGRAEAALIALLGHVRKMALRGGGVEW